MHTQTGNIQRNAGGVGTTVTDAGAANAALHGYGNATVVIDTMDTVDTVDTIGPSGNNALLTQRDIRDSSSSSSSSSGGDRANIDCCHGNDRMDGQLTNTDSDTGTGTGTDTDSRAPCSGVCHSWRMTASVYVCVLVSWIGVINTQLVGKVIAFTFSCVDLLLMMVLALELRL